MKKRLEDDPILGSKGFSVLVAVVGAGWLAIEIRQGSWLWIGVAAFVLLLAIADLAMDRGEKGR